MILAYLTFPIVALARIYIISNIVEYAIVCRSLCHTNVFPIQIRIILPQTARDGLKTTSLETNHTILAFRIVITVRLANIKKGSGMMDWSTDGQIKLTLKITYHWLSGKIRERSITSRPDVGLVVVGIDVIGLWLGDTVGSDVVGFIVSGLWLGASVGLNVSGLWLGDTVGSDVVGLEVTGPKLGLLDGLYVSGLLLGNKVGSDVVGLDVAGPLLGMSVNGLLLGDTDGSSVVGWAVVGLAVVGYQIKWNVLH